MSISDAVEMPQGLEVDGGVSVGSPSEVSKEERERREKEAEKTPETATQEAEPELQFLRKDGTRYDEPPGKQVSKHPLRSIVVRVKDDGSPVEGEPRYQRQLVDKAWKGTWRLSPRKWVQLNMSNQADVETLNELEQDSEPAGCPRVIISNRQMKFDKNTGSFVWLVSYVRVTYFEVISTS